MEFKSGLPADLQSHPALAGIDDDVSALASKFVEAHAYTQGDGWKGALLEEYKNDPSIATIKDFNSLVKNYLHTKKMVGADKVAVPGKNAAKEDWDAFYSALGRPESPDAYSLPKPQDGESFDAGANKLFRETMYNLGLSDTAAKGVFDYLVQVAEGELQSMSEAEKAEKERVEGLLKQEWGQAYQQKMASVFRLIDAFADGEAKDALKAEIGSSPALIKMFEKIGAKAMEDKALGLGAGVGDMLSPTEAKAKADAIKRDKSHPYHDKNAPGHAEAVLAMQKLYDMMYPAAQ